MVDLVVVDLGVDVLGAMLEQLAHAQKEREGAQQASEPDEPGGLGAGQPQPASDREVDRRGERLHASLDEPGLSARGRARSASTAR